jgi:hypothetical protein
MAEFVGARRLALAFGTAALLVGAIVLPASAGTVTAQITAGGLTASVGDLSFPASPTTMPRRTSPARWS